MNDETVIIDTFVQEKLSGNIKCEGAMSLKTSDVAPSQWLRNVCRSGQTVYVGGGYSM